MAQEYLLAIETETLGFVSVGEEEELVAAMRRGFCLPRLQGHLRIRLTEAPPETRPARAGAELIARHPPTVWSAFQLAVQERLIAREVLGRQGLALPPVEVQSRPPAPTDGIDWRQDLEWQLMPLLRQLIPPREAPSRHAHKQQQQQQRWRRRRPRPRQQQPKVEEAAVEERARVSSRDLPVAGASTPGGLAHKWHAADTAKATEGAGSARTLQRQRRKRPGKRTSTSLAAEAAITAAASARRDASTAVIRNSLQTPCPLGL